MSVKAKHGRTSRALTDRIALTDLTTNRTYPSQHGAVFFTTLQHFVLSAVRLLDRHRSLRYGIHLPFGLGRNSSPRASRLVLFRCSRVESSARFRLYQSRSSSIIVDYKQTQAACPIVTRTIRCDSPTKLARGLRYAM